MRRLVKIFLFFSLVLFGKSLVAQDSSIKATATLSKPMIKIGDWVELSLKVEGANGKSIEWPFVTDTVSANIEVVNISPIDTIVKGTGKVLQQVITLTSYDSGYHAIPPFIFVYDKISDTVFSQAETQALLLQVNTLSVDTTANFMDIKPILDEPKSYFNIFMWVGIFYATVFAILFAIYFYKRYKANKPLIEFYKKPELPADIIAVDSLNKLKEKKLWQNGQTKEYYSELTDIIRLYIEKRFEFPAMEMVTNEIVGCMKSSNLDQKLIDESKAQLEMADGVKFAKLNTLPDENHGIMNWAFDFVAKTRNLDKPMENNS